MQRKKTTRACATYNNLMCVNIKLCRITVVENTSYAYLLILNTSYPLICKRIESFSSIIPLAQATWYRSFRADCRAQDRQRSLFTTD